jgi:hypothetical protein
LPEKGEDYVAKLLATIKAQDMFVAAAVMADGMALWAKAMRTVDVTQIAYLRAGEYANLLHSAFIKFDEEDWHVFERMTTHTLHGDLYDELALQTYGEEYIAYKKNLQVATLAQVKAAVGGEAFHQTLRAYIAGISPAISYGMNYD